MTAAGQSCTAIVLTAVFCLNIGGAAADVYLRRTPDGRVLFWQPPASNDPGVSPDPSTHARLEHTTVTRVGETACGVRRPAPYYKPDGTLVVPEKYFECCTTWTCANAHEWTDCRQAEPSTVREQSNIGPP
jgi:hypothetical protein